MGCDIHGIIEVKLQDAWVRVENDPYEGRYYGLFGWLAGVRNYSAVGPYKEQRGFPQDCSVKGGDESTDVYMGDHSFSWYTLEELEAVDYEQLVNDRRVGRWESATCFNGANTGEEEEGQETSLRKFLAEEYFKVLDRMREYSKVFQVAPACVRWVFGFDS